MFFSIFTEFQQQNHAYMIFINLISTLISFHILVSDFNDDNVAVDNTRIDQRKIA